jgi:hypothetical protein
MSIGHMIVQVSVRMFTYLHAGRGNAILYLRETDAVEEDVLRSASRLVWFTDHEGIESGWHGHWDLMTDHDDPAGTMYFISFNCKGAGFPLRHLVIREVGWAGDEPIIWFENLTQYPVRMCLEAIYLDHDSEDDAEILWP